MAAANKLMRDVLIDTIFEAARKDRGILFLSADLGAAALDRFRAELPGQFIHAAISEQNMVDLAAGLSTAGKRVYVYAMASFVTARCFEQIKCALAVTGRPVTIVSVGVGLGYDDAGPTHYTTEDIACMRALAGIEILSPADEASMAAIAALTLAEPKLRYLRLERPAQPRLYDGGVAELLPAGMAEVAPGHDVCIVASGYMLHRALAARAALLDQGYEPGVVDLFRVKPVDGEALAALLAPYDSVLTVEEQCLAGGFGSAVLEALSDAGVGMPVTRLGLPERYYFENGGRDYLLDRFGLGVADIARAVKRSAAPRRRAVA